VIETRALVDCTDCGAKPGTPHQVGCDTELCVLCGQQALFHVTYDEEDGLPEGPAVCPETGEVIPDEPGIWTGVWPGVLECREFGWYARWTSYVDWIDGEIVVTEHPTDRVPVPNSGESIPCEASHPHAHEDLNRLALAAATGEVVWSRDLQRFVLCAELVP
jgi:hypothetical protein